MDGWVENGWMDDGWMDGWKMVGWTMVGWTMVGWIDNMLVKEKEICKQAFVLLLFIYFGIELESILSH